MIRKLLAAVGLMKQLDPCQDKPIEARSSRWPSVRAAHLKDNPACAACGGTKHLEVHHVKPYHLHHDLELDPENLITLCEAPGANDHFTLGHLRDWRAFNPSVRDDAAALLAKIKARRYS